MLCTDSEQRANREQIRWEKAPFFPTCFLVVSQLFAICYDPGTIQLAIQTLVLAHCSKSFLCRAMSVNESNHRHSPTFSLAIRLSGLITIPLYDYLINQRVSAVKRSKCPLTYYYFLQAIYRLNSPFRLLPRNNSRNRSLHEFGTERYLLHQM